MVGVAEDVLDDIFGDAALAQEGGAVLRVLVEGGMDFPIEVMQQTDQAPVLHVLTKFLGVETHGSLHRKHVADKSFVFNILTYKS